MNIIDSTPQSIEIQEELKENFFKEALRSMKKNRMATAGGIAILLIILIAIFAPLITPYDPYIVDLKNQFIRPNIAHLLGTDMYGRDVLARIIYGARISLLIGIVPTTITMIIGTFLGIISGYYGGKTDFIIMSIVNMVLAFPSLLLAMVVMYTLGASLLNIFIALSIVGWGGTARVVRAQTLSFKNKEFIEASRAIGIKDIVIMMKHILPNCIPQLIVLFTLNIPGSILSEASLSFLGVGAQPPASSWGLMVSNGKEYLFNASWVAIAPGVAILIIVLAFNFLGDGLRDTLDPYLKQ